jgi:hypothetical protein
VGELLQRLAPGIRAPLEQALEQSPHEEPPKPRTRTALKEALQAAGFANGKALIPLATELDDTQRAVAEILSLHDELPDLVGFAIPSQAWKIRRWLGAAPAGALEQIVEHTLDGEKLREPLWRALRRHERPGKAAQEFFHSLDLSLAERLDAYGDIVLGAYGVRRRGLTWGEPVDIGADCGSWAERAADRLLEVRHGTTPVEIKWAIYLALVRGDRPIAERWFPLFPAEEGREALMAECARALPEDRRDEVLTAAVRGLSFSVAIVRVGLVLLEEFPSTALTQLVLARGDGAASAPAKNGRVTKKELTKRLQQIGGQHPVVADALERHLANLPPLVVLGVDSVLRPTSVDALSATQREQLVEAGRSHDGEQLSAAQRLAADDEDHSFAGTLEIRVLVDATGRPAYDAWLYRGDSGAVFRAGTTEIVAEIIQANVECDDEALRDALRKVLR